ncbi:unnamed protein product, partial [Cladocopium goreaui]
VSHGAGPAYTRHQTTSGRKSARGGYQETTCEMWCQDVKGVPTLQCGAKFGTPKVPASYSQGALSGPKAPADSAALPLLLSTLNTALADAVPVKVNELFLTAFYSPSAMAEVPQSSEAHVNAKSFENLDVHVYSQDVFAPNEVLDPLEVSAIDTMHDALVDATKILRNPDPGFWRYGFYLSSSLHILHGLQASPTSEDKDLDILQLPPADDSLLGPEAPFERSTYVGVIMFGSRMVLPAGLGLSTGPQECAAYATTDLDPPRLSLTVLEEGLEELDTNIDIGRNTVSFRKIGEDDLSLLCTARGQQYDEVREGWNPDDWLDYRFELDHWREEAANAEKALQEIRAELSWGDPCPHPRDVQDDGQPRDDSHVFEALMAQQPQLNRKTKKIQAMSNAVDGGAAQGHHKGLEDMILAASMFSQCRAPLMPPTPSDGYEPSTAPDINQELPPVPEDDDDFMKELSHEWWFLVLSVWTVWTHEFPFEAKSRMAVQGQVYEASIIPCLQKHSGCRADGITLTGIEDGDYLRSLLIELKYPGKKILGLDLQFQKAMMACFTGANKELGKHPQQGRHARKTAKRDQKGWDHDGCGSDAVADYEILCYKAGLRSRSVFGGHDGIIQAIQDGMQAVDFAIGDEAYLLCDFFAVKPLCCETFLLWDFFAVPRPAAPLNPVESSSLGKAAVLEMSGWTGTLAVNRGLALLNMNDRNFIRLVETIVFLEPPPEGDPPEDSENPFGACEHLDLSYRIWNIRGSVNIRLEKVGDKAVRHGQWSLLQARSSRTVSQSPYYFDDADLQFLRHASFSEECATLTYHWIKSLAWPETECAMFWHSKAAEAAALVR